MAEESRKEMDHDSDGASEGASYTVLMDQVEAVLQVLETAEATLQKLQRPIESLALDQLGEVPFLLTSPFRQEKFSLKRAPSVRLSFHTICSELRAHSLPLTREGVIQTSPFLREQMNISTETTTFPQLLRSLTYSVA